MRILLVTPDAVWAEMLDAELGAAGHELSRHHGAQPALKELQERPAGHFGAMVFSVFPLPGQAELETIAEAVMALNELRGDPKGQIPALLCSRTNDSRLTQLLPRSDAVPVSVLHNDTPEAVAAALAARRAPPCAIVEIEVGANEVRLRVDADGATLTEFVHSWGGRTKMRRLEDKFAKWVPLSNQGGRRDPDPRWKADCTEAGTDLAEELALSGSDFQKAINECEARLGQANPVHYRFNLLHDEAEPLPRFAHVPFELVYNAAKSSFIRVSSPVARRLRIGLAGPRGGVPAAGGADAGAQRFVGPILFVKANAHGKCATETVEFGGAREILLRPLRALDAELGQLRTALDKAKASDRLLPPLLLEWGGDAVTALKDAIAGAQGPRLLHYAGHSTRADDGEVYLMLPGEKPGQVRPLAVAKLAPWLREAGVRLVILSSCESASPLAMLRLAREDIPAAIGFRWEVEDSEAAAFTGLLHSGLAGGLPLARAFHAAVRDVCPDKPDSPTFASAMLVVQEEEWAG